MARRKRQLGEEELALWRQVAERVTPLGPRLPEPVAPRAAAPNGKPAPPRPTAPPPAPKAQGPAGPAPIQMDAKAHKRLVRGRMDPEARIDLHGMTLAQAHASLTSFILASRATGRRLVLVITGKGKARDDGGPIPPQTGLLRRQVPLWLREPPLAGSVLEISEAHRKHGGSGALYVYLKRQR